MSVKNSISSLPRRQIPGGLPCPVFLFIMKIYLSNKVKCDLLSNNIFLFLSQMRTVGRNMVITAEMAFAINVISDY